MDPADPAAVPQASATSLQQSVVGAQPVLPRTQSRVWTEGAASPTWEAQHHREPLPKIQWCQWHQPLHPRWDPGRGLVSSSDPATVTLLLICLPRGKISEKKNIIRKIIPGKITRCCLWGCVGSVWEP